MKAYKFLGPDGVGRFSGFAWPLPNASKPGEWVEASGPLRPCHVGIHACTTQHLPFWFDAALWEVELDGELVETRHMVVARRGRLLRRVPGWSESLAHQLCEFCVNRVEALGTPAAAYLDDVKWLAGRTHAAATTHISAVVAGKVAGDAGAEDAEGRERRVQAEWLTKHLGLS